ncbi:50S ribosomal protein L11 methyltransferase [Tissierella sp. MSJ-40]|uniref:Ribosomal protein L11 methyltransferase n=1 Tax=Tissierella simiarum TaxID=2841534 RepID=A0ABS6E5Y1_9FIRM|nr:50S ribosomal protein L11 methyltransferase [Tissierella simiarum]MBU5438330.1 50S ribosomal protein L11 methyltransferase [Tissierella simiarum]
MKWIEVQVKTTTEAEDIVSNILYDLGANGLAIEDPKDILELSQSKEDWDFIDPSLIDLDFEGILIKAYFSESEDLPDKIELIKQSIEKSSQYNIDDKVLGEVIISEVNDNDWAESWKKYYKPKKIGNRIIIKPSWEEYEPKETDLIIELDPGMAFGTGTHETTIMCAEALEKYMKSGNIVYDIGCGSGILSIVAAKLGADKVLGIDLDELCVKVSKENIELNHVENIVEIKKGNLLDIVHGKANIVVSNIIAEIIAGMTKELKDYLEKDGLFIGSGIIIEKIDLVKDSLEQNGFKILEIKKMNDWSCIVAIVE